MHRVHALIGVFVLCVITSPTVYAWHQQEHQFITAAVQRILPDDVPGWFVAGVPGLAAHCSVDPDVFKSRGTPHLRDAEAPEHYLDLELLGGTKLPKTRYTYLALCAKKGVDPEKAGPLPYAVIEWTQRLTLPSPSTGSGRTIPTSVPSAWSTRVISPTTPPTSASHCTRRSTSTVVPTWTGPRPTLASTRR